MTPNDDYSGRTAPQTSKCCILYIYSTHIFTEYFKHVTFSPFFSLQNAVCFIILTYLVPVLFTFYIQGAKIKKINSGAKTLIHPSSGVCEFSIVSPHWLCVLVSMCVGVSVWLGWGGIRVAG